MKTNTKSNLVPFKEFRLNAQKYIDAIERGKSFVVIKRSKPVFRIVPVPEVWETVVDFTSIYPKGIPAKKLLQYLK